MDTSLPISPILEQELLNFAGHKLSILSSSDVAISEPAPIVEPTGQPTYTDARAWIAIFQQRLPAKLYSRFLDILSQCSSGTGMLETPRVEFSRLFAEANESELWEEFLTSFFQPWKKTLQIEESELAIVDTIVESRNAGQKEIEIWEELKQGD